MWIFLFFVGVFLHTAHVAQDINPQKLFIVLFYWLLHARIVTQMLPSYNTSQIEGWY